MAKGRKKQAAAPSSTAKGKQGKNAAPAQQSLVEAANDEAAGE